MGKNYYIVAIELSSSKVSGAVGIETTEGIKILATASRIVDGFISKGIVRNVDKTSEAITGIINMLDPQLKDVEIKKAYISFAGLSVHSIKSKVSKGFGQYTKITKEIIDSLECENEATFVAPEGYIRILSNTQEYRLDGNIEQNPIGVPASSIECNYLNIVMKEQFYKQLEESFTQAQISIADSLSAARLDADIMLSNDQRRNGCALVNIGSDTTTISIYNNDKPRMLTVLPLGSNNITRDIATENISLANAEEIKIIRGYKSAGNDNEHINSDKLDSIIYARMGEILQNVRYKLEESGERVHYIIFTGGGSKLKNLSLLLEEFLPNFKTEIKPEPRFNLISENGINVDGVINTVLYGLLKQGKENCCEEIMPAAQQNENIFSQEEMEGKNDNANVKIEENEVVKVVKEVTTQNESVNEKDRIKPDVKRKPSIFDKVKNSVKQWTIQFTNDTEEEQENDNDNQ